MCQTYFANQSNGNARYFDGRSFEDRAMFLRRQNTKVQHRTRFVSQIETMYNSPKPPFRIAAHKYTRLIHPESQQKKLQKKGLRIERKKASIVGFEGLKI